MSTSDESKIFTGKQLAAGVLTGLAFAAFARYAVPGMSETERLWTPIILFLAMFVLVPVTCWVGDGIGRDVARTVYAPQRADIARIERAAEAELDWNADMSRKLDEVERQLDVLRRR